MLTFANLVYVMRRELDPEQIEDVRKGPALIFLHDIQRNSAFAGTPVADTDCIGIRHAESLPGIEVNTQIQTEQVSDKKILRIGVLLVVYEDVDDVGKRDGMDC